jgi:hypothetical protein
MKLSTLIRWHKAEGARVAAEYTKEGWVKSESREHLHRQRIHFQTARALEELEERRQEMVQMEQDREGD